MMLGDILRSILGGLWSSMMWLLIFWDLCFDNCPLTSFVERSECHFTQWNVNINHSVRQKNVKDMIVLKLLDQWCVSICLRNETLHVNDLFNASCPMNQWRSVMSLSFDEVQTLCFDQFMVIWCIVDCYCYAWSVMSLSFAETQTQCSNNTCAPLASLMLFRS